MIETTNKARSILNDTFIKYELDTTSYNKTTIKAVLHGKRKERLYTIVNSQLLQINNDKKVYDYEINGTSGKNTKNIVDLGLPFDYNSTEKLSDIIRED